MLEGEKEKLLRMEEALAKRVVGQQSRAHRNRTTDSAARAQGWPIHAGRTASFLFLGPPVGKTELCKALAGFLFDSEEAMVRIDMSEFMEKHSVARLIGRTAPIRGVRGRRLPDRGRTPPALRRDPAR